MSKSRYDLIKSIPTILRENPIQEPILRNLFWDNQNWDNPSWENPFDRICWLISWQSISCFERTHLERNPFKLRDKSFLNFERIHFNRIHFERIPFERVPFEIIYSEKITFEKNRFKRICFEMIPFPFKRLTFWENFLQTSREFVSRDSAFSRLFNFEQVSNSQLTYRHRGTWLAWVFLAHSSSAVHCICSTLRGP